MKKIIGRFLPAILLLTFTILLIARNKRQSSVHIDPYVELRALLAGYTGDSAYSLAGSISAHESSPEGTLLDSSGFRCCSNGSGKLFSLGCLTTMEHGGLLLSLDSSEHTLSLDSCFAKGKLPAFDGIIMLTQRLADTSYCRLSVSDSGSLRILKVIYNTEPGVEYTNLVYVTASHRLRSAETMFLRPPLIGTVPLRTVTRALVEIDDRQRPDIGRDMLSVFKVQGKRFLFSPRYENYRMSLFVP